MDAGENLAVGIAAACVEAQYRQAMALATEKSLKDAAVRHKQRGGTMHEFLRLTAAAMIVRDEPLDLACGYMMAAMDKWLEWERDGTFGAE